MFEREENVMKNLNRILSIVAVFVLLFGSFPTQAVQAQTAVTDTATQVGEGPDQPFGETIPDEIGFLVNAANDQIYTYHWGLETVVTLIVDDPATKKKEDYSTSATVVDDNAGYTKLIFDLTDIFDIQPGFEITLRDGVTTKTHVVTALAVTNVDVDTDVVSGVAAPESALELWGCWEDGCHGSREALADNAGNWFSDFSDESQVTYDFLAGSWAVAAQWDEDNDGTLSGWVVPENAPDPEPAPETEADTDPEADPVLLSPINGELLTDNIPAFYWEETLGAVQYQVNVVDSKGDDALLGWYAVGTDVICVDGLCAFEPDISLSNDTYTWFVRPWEDDFDSWYAEFTFTIDAPEGKNGDVHNSDGLPATPTINSKSPDFLWDNNTNPGFPPAGPGLFVTPLIAGQDMENPAGVVAVWNSRDKLFIRVELNGAWLINTIQVYYGIDPVPTSKSGNPVQGHFPIKEEYPDPVDRYFLVLDMEEDLGFRWGQPYEYLRVQNIAVHADLVILDESEEERGPNPGDPRVLEEEGAWAYGDGTFEGSRWAWWIKYEMAHPRRAHFIDSPVEGVSFETPTHVGKTDESGGFDYFPGETVELSIGSVFLGSTLIEQKISPLDIFENGDLDDPRVINMARLLQSLDVDADPKAGISITDDVVACFEQSVADLGLTSLNFADDAQIEAVVQGTINLCAGVVSLVSVSAEDAIANLDRSINANMHRRGVSRTPELTSSKSKLNIMGVWFPALRANGDAQTIEYFDENGELIRTADEAKPIVVVYTDGVEETGYEDIFAGISRDDGNTFKRMNLSRAADRTSFTLENGLEYFGQAKKPVFQVKGNNILVAWTSKFCNGGKPRYAIDPDDDYPYDDAYYEGDTWGVGGPQRSIDYTDIGFPEVGEIPYSCVWVARGTVVTDKMINSGGYWADKVVGDIVWFKPERLTSGRRDANQIFIGGADGAGFAITWQEDPEGLRPGEAAGPGPGWSGATTNHKTDIWYSYITMSDFSKVDVNFVSGGDPQHELDVTGRPKALVPMAMPVRITDNAAVNTDNMKVELDEDGYPVLDENGEFIPTDNVYSTSDTSAISYEAENLTSCVKFEGGETIVERDSTEAATYHALPSTLPIDHLSTKNCTNCHVPFGLEPHDIHTPTQGAPIPLVVVDATIPEYLGGFTNADCVSCHYNNVVPRDRVIPVTPGLDVNAKVAECNSKGAIWKDEIEAYYPYEGYPYIPATEDDSTGAHNYAYKIPGVCENFYEFTNNQGALKRVCITEDGRLLDGDTGASRPNIFLQTYTKPDGSKSAWAIMAYEETKGMGLGDPGHVPDGGPYGDDESPDVGKNAIYHSFDFQNPEVVSAGNIINLPERDENGDLVYVVNPETGEQLLDYLGRPQLSYENARRPRFVLQGKSATGDSKTVMLVLYREGQEGSGRPADTMLRRVVASPTGNPYAFENFVCDAWETAANGEEVCVAGVQNMSSVTPTEVTPSMGDPIAEDPYGAVKVVKWQQGPGNLNDSSSANPYDDSRAHRGQIRGDFIVMGFTYTPNWAAARNGNDKYDLFIRRSFDGGQTWTTDPTMDPNEVYETCDTFTDPLTKEKTEVCNQYAPGEFEQMRNMSQLANNKETVIEPRIVAPPGTIKENGVWTGRAEDKQNTNVFYVSYGTSTNPPIEHGDSTVVPEMPVPLDLYYTFTQDRGNSYQFSTWEVNPDSDGNYAGEVVTRWAALAKGDEEQGEAQLRMTPDGTRFYSTWLQEGNGSSDIWFRRIMPYQFKANQGSQ
jgi:hypothetical protein